MVNLKKIFFRGMSCLLFFSIVAGAADESTYKDMTKEGFDGLVLEENFEGPLQGWTLTGKGMVVKPHEGLNGNGCLFYERKDPKEYPAISKPVELQHGVVYKIRIDYKTEFINKGGNEFFCVRYFKNGERLSGTFHMSSDKKLVRDWDRLERTFTIPDEADSARASILLRTGRLGKIWYDNFVIEPVGGRPGRLYPLAPQSLALNESGEITFHAESMDYMEGKGLSISLEINGTKQTAVVKNDRGEFTLGNLPFGEYKYKAILKDDQKRLILAHTEGRFFRHKEKKNIISINSSQTVFLNEKKTLPVICFFGHIKEENTVDALARIREAGFNGILSVPRWITKPKDKNLSDSAQLLALLDLLQKNDLKFIYSIKYQLGNKPNAIKKFDFAEGIHNVTLKMVKTVKDHPAMLGWYISDENPLADIGLIRDLRERIASIDPNHPAITLTNMMDNFKEFASTGDILAIDAYPIASSSMKLEEEQDDGNMAGYVDAGMKTKLPVWNTIQIFSWGAFDSMDTKSSLVMRHPTEQEMCSMILTSAIHGVKAFLFYAYHPVIYYAEEKVPGSGKKQWLQIVKAVQMLRSIEQYLLSDAKTPQVQITQLAGKKAEACAFSLENGETIVAISCGGPKESKAELYVPGKDQLVSQYGKTKNLGGGRYLFTGKHVDCDLLKE
ncbi:MAG: hypothetical protein WCT05_04705 [Lentisphaeria bacterium]